MKFFLDENVPKAVSEFLSSLKHELIDPRGTELEGASDLKLFESARASSAIFITTDKDFYHTVPFLVKSHHGVIVIALSQPNSKNITEKVRWFINHTDLTMLRDKAVLLTDKRYYISKS